MISRKSIVIIIVAIACIMLIFLPTTIPSQKHNLVIMTEPEGCDVKIGDSVINSGGGGEAIFMIPEGSQDITVSKSGWTPISKKIDLTKDMVLTISLKQVYHDLIVRTSPPDCDVTINEETKNSGSQGARFILAEGPYRIFVDKDKYIQSSQKIDLTDDRTIIVGLSLIKYNITVNTEPYPINVYLDKEGATRQTKLSTTGSVVFKDLTPGIYQVTGNKYRYEDLIKTVVIEDTDKEIDLSLTQTICDLTVKTDPIGCLVTVDGVGEKTSDGSGIAKWTNLERGTYEITVLKESYHTEEQTITLDEDKTFEYKLDLPYLKVTSPMGYADSSYFKDYTDNYVDNINIYDNYQYFLVIKGTYTPGQRQIDQIKAYLPGINDKAPLNNPGTTWTKNVRLYGNVQPGKQTIIVKGFYKGKLVETVEHEVILPTQLDFELSTIGMPDEPVICRGCSWADDWWLGLPVPLEGVIKQINGKVKMDLLGNPNDCEVWIDIYNPNIDAWDDAVYKIINPVQGWNDFSVYVNTYTDYWGIAGCHWYNDLHRAYHRPLEFVGTITWEVGSWEPWDNFQYQPASVNDVKPLTIPAHTQCPGCDTYDTDLVPVNPNAVQTPGFEFVGIIIAIGLVSLVLWRKRR